ncbi:MAG: class I SAM-dependent methyltransferase [Chloroflexota bacterium]|nr:class I SAM-dependent methyltransferase [Chloroflexota bacterium]
MDHRRRVQNQFGAAAEAYVASRSHAEGADLARLATWAAEEGGSDKRALDVATGGGHTALALVPWYGLVVASDLTPRMLVSAAAAIRAHGAGNVVYAGAAAERLPFAGAAFDLVTCRIAPHHFGNVASFAAEVARVLRPGGVFLLEDSIAPEDPTLDDWLNRAEALRDPTHVRSLSARRWRALLDEAGFAVEMEAVFPKAHPFEDWIARARVPGERRAALVAAFRDAPPAARQTFAITMDGDGNVVSYTDEKILLRARKR